VLFAAMGANVTQFGLAEPTFHTLTFVPEALETECRCLPQSTH